MKYVIRKGIMGDIPCVFRLIRELAVYEAAVEEVTNTPQKMLEEGFGENSNYSFFVAEFESSKEIFGAAIYYYRYSTWKGTCIHLEDLIVTENHRGIGAGKSLFEATALECKNQGLPLMTWQVLDWNKPAIHFYEKYKADFDNTWINCKLKTT